MERCDGYRGGVRRYRMVRQLKGSVTERYYRGVSVDREV